MALAAATTAQQDVSFLEGGGKMGERMRAHDWSKTSLGPPETWPLSLKTVIRIVLTSRYAMWMLWGPDLTFFCNDAYLPTLGVKQTWALGARSDKVWEEIWPDIGPRIESVLRTNVATWDENLLLFLERSGYQEETYHTFSYSPLADDAGATVGMLCVVTEETDKVIGERRLAFLGRAATKLTAVLSENALFSALDDVCAGNPDLPFGFAFLTAETGEPRVQMTSAAQKHESFAHRTTDLLRANLAHAGQSHAIALPPDLVTDAPSGPWYKQPTHCAIVTLTEGGASAPAGYLLIGLNPLRSFDDSYCRFLELLGGQISSSLTNVRAHEAERKRAASLAEIDRAKTVFFSNISHEFRTPLTLMLGPVHDILEDHRTALAPAHRGRLEVAERNAVRLLKLVNALLDFSRIEAGRVQATYEPLDLAAYTADLASGFQSATDRAGLPLVIDCDSIGEQVYIDREMWEKIVLNLISNAFKFTFEGQISVGLHRVGDRVELLVKDSGVGIPEEDLPHLFERFYRVEGQRSRTHEGSGIGLALVHELVNLHGGSITAESEPGRGSTFRVRIPLGAGHLPADRIGKERKPEGRKTGADAFVQETLGWLPDGGEGEIFDTLESDLPDVPMTMSSARVLLVDDNIDMRRYVQRLLSAHWQVEVASDGVEALEAIKRQRPDLVLSDVMMPRLDGVGLLRAIRNTPALQDMPVILLSARAGEQAQIEGFGAGANDYLVKPFSARELVSRVAAHLELARLRQESTEALRQRTAQFETLLNAAPMGVYLVDADFRIRDINPTAAPLFAKIPDVIGRDFDEVIHILWNDPQADEVVRIFRHTLETGEIYISPEWIDTRRDSGVTEYYDWQLHRIPLPEGRFGVVAYFRDISFQVQARQRQKLLVDELNHRVKNTLATVQSIALQTLRTARTASEARNHLDARLVALSKTHDVLTREQWAKANLRDIVGAAVAAYGGKGDSRFRIEGPAADMQPRAAVALSMALHELSTNAAKYGALSNDHGNVAITWSFVGDAMHLRWAESGGPAVTPPRNRGFGSRLIERGLAQDLAGDVRLDFAPAGVICTITAPARELLATARDT